MPKKNPESAGDIASEIEGAVAAAPKLPQAVVETASQAAKSVYNVEQLAEHCEVLEASREIVVVALRRGGKTTYTLEEAQKLVKGLKDKEVK